LGRTSYTRDGGCRAVAHWQTTPNWKKVGRRNPPFSNHFYRVTRWGHVTRFRDSWPSSRLFGPRGPPPRHAIWPRRPRPIVANPCIRAKKSQGPPVGADGPCLDRDGLWNPIKWRRPRRLETGIEIRHPPGTCSRSIDMGFPSSNSHSWPDGEVATLGCPASQVSISLFRAWPL
jgi:hypothetical protein